VSASHILVLEEKDATKLLKQITKDPSKFEELAKENSTCPSKSKVRVVMLLTFLFLKGGDLGSFKKGQMVKEFEEVCFGADAEVGKVYGPIKTSFGYHLV
jgi:peptidyl-prolyl cis-trans isomerase C